MAGPLAWQIATLSSVRDETASVKSLTFALPDFTPHLPGQHYDIRLTAEDGYQAQRSYSIASSPDQTGSIDLTVERIEGGEVSSFLHDTFAVGDQVELRGPIGGYFVWQASMGGPLLLVAGGSGVVPLMAMLRHRAGAASASGAASVPTALVYSSRTRDDVIYFDELERLRGADRTLAVIHTLTRSQPPGWTGGSRRIDRQMLADATASFPSAPQAFICGPTLLVEAAADALVGLGLSTSQIRTERFGPTGT